MRGDGLSFPVNPDAGGESASYDWAGAVGPREEARDSGSLPNGFAGEERVCRTRREDDGEIA